MKRTTKKISRREFLKKTGTFVAGTSLAGLAPSLITAKRSYASISTINLAYILSDHHAPLMVTAKNWELFQEKYNMYLKPISEGKYYDFYHDGGKVARVKLIPTKKGPDLEKLVAQGSVDIGISGTQAILMSIDKGVKTRIVSPLQAAGNVFVLKKGLPMNNWTDFVKEIKGSQKRFKIGMPGPHTVAAIIFRSALDHEGISYTEDIANKKADILFINMKGHGNLVAALTNNITEGIIGAQPFPSVTINRGVGKFIINLQDVPPSQQWEGHACCSLEATEKFVQQDKEMAIKMVELLCLGVNISNEQKDLTAQACSEWLGVEKSVEQVAMQTLNYTTTPSKRWKQSVYTYAETMDKMGMFGGKLHGKRNAMLDLMVFNFNYVNEAKKRLKQKKLIS